MKHTKNKTLFGKKGQFFTGLFVVLVLIIFTTLYLDLISKTHDFPHKIGEKQYAALAAAQDGEKAILYTDYAASYAYSAAILETAKKNYVDSSLCGSYRGVPVVYGITDCMAYDDKLEKEVERAVGDHFNIALNPYLEQYEPVSFVLDNYFLDFKRGKINGIPYEPLEIPIFSTTSRKIEPSARASSDAAFITFDQWPVALDTHYVTSCFGNRASDVERVGGSSYHPGVDIQAPLGTPIVSVASGTVVETEPVKWGRVVIDHGNNIFSVYVHLDTAIVSVGDAVAKGQQIGTAGARGRATGSHLHFGIIDKNIPPTLKDSRGAKAVLPSFSYTRLVNPLCYLISDISFTYNTKSTSCNSDGGAYKFCTLYKKTPGISVAYDATLKKYSYTPAKSTEQMLLGIDQNYGTLIEQAVAGTSLSKSMVIGLIAQESSGNPNAGSDTGCQGLMQFCLGTAKAYGLSSADRLIPEKAIPAGVLLLQDDINMFSKYTDNIKFSLAAYNGGSGTIQGAIKATGKIDPSWEEVAAAMDESLIAEYFKGQYFDTSEERKGKAKQIQEYPDKVLMYAAGYESLQKAS